MRWRRHLDEVFVRIDGEIYDLWRTVDHEDEVRKNGKSFDAGDVVYSINLRIGEDSKSGAKAMLSTIRNLRTDRHQTVAFVVEAKVSVALESGVFLDQVFQLGSPR